MGDDGFFSYRPERGEKFASITVVDGCIRAYGQNRVYSCCPIDGAFKGRNFGGVLGPGGIGRGNPVFDPFLDKQRVILFRNCYLPRVYWNSSDVPPGNGQTHQSAIGIYGPGSI